jgi:hypothetical protein
MLETLRTDFRDIVHAEVRECSRQFNGSSRAESKGSGFTTVGGEHEAPEVPAPKGRFPRRFKIIWNSVNDYFGRIWAVTTLCSQ